LLARLRHRNLALPDIAPSGGPAPTAGPQPPLALSRSVAGPAGPAPTDRVNSQPSHLPAGWPSQAHLAVGHPSSILARQPGPEMLHGALKSVTDKVWAAYMHVGILAILQNRVASADKFRALILVESTMSILGENWLLDCTHLPDDQNPLSVDKSLLLILESARVEVAVLLDELAYLNFSSNMHFISLTIVELKQGLALICYKASVIGWLCQDLPE
ncbi:hypothetical protein Taro_051895, partial [Colocasia esculenta]|nr:hypothetical protein [Colocasia esculenta]